MLTISQLFLGSALFDEAMCPVVGVIASYAIETRSLTFAHHDPDCPPHLAAAMKLAGEAEPLASLPELARKTVDDIGEDDAWLLVVCVAQAMGASSVHIAGSLKGAAYLALGPVQKLPGMRAGLDEAQAARIIVRLVWPVELALSRALTKREMTDAISDRLKAARSQPQAAVKTPQGQAPRGDVPALVEAVEAAAVLAGELSRCARQAKLDAPAFEGMFQEASDAVEQTLLGIEEAARTESTRTMLDAIAALHMALQALLVKWRK